jgi:hypothetical protein
MNCCGAATSFEPIGTGRGRAPQVIARVYVEPAPLQCDKLFVQVHRNLVQHRRGAEVGAT